MVTLGEVIAEHRRETGMPQREYAHLFGFKQASVSNWQHNQPVAPEKILPRLSELTGRPLAELVRIREATLKLFPGQQPARKAELLEETVADLQARTLRLEGIVEDIRRLIAELATVDADRPAAKEGLTPAPPAGKPARGARPRRG